MPAIGATNPHARRLRRDATECGMRVWLAVRDRQLGGFTFRRQATIGPFVVNFLCIDQRLIVEIDGGQHMAAGDAERTAYIERRGYRVVRFWNNDVVDDLDGILSAILAALHSPSPNPLPQAGEGHLASDHP